MATSADSDNSQTLSKTSKTNSTPCSLLSTRPNCRRTNLLTRRCSHEEPLIDRHILLKWKLHAGFCCQLSCRRPDCPQLLYFLAPSRTTEKGFPAPPYRDRRLLSYANVNCRALLPRAA